MLRDFLGAVCGVGGDGMDFAALGGRAWLIVRVTRENAPANGRDNEEWSR
jgi:hypothetical protein